MGDLRQLHKSFSVISIIINNYVFILKATVADRRAGHNYLNYRQDRYRIYLLSSILSPVSRKKSYFSRPEGSPG